MEKKKRRQAFRGAHLTTWIIRDECFLQGSREVCTIHQGFSSNSCTHYRLKDTVASRRRILRKTLKRTNRFSLNDQERLLPEGVGQVFNPHVIPRTEADTIQISEVSVRSQAFDGPRHCMYYTVVDQMVGKTLGNGWLTGCNYSK